MFKSGPAGYHKNQLLAGAMMMLREMGLWKERMQMRTVVSKRTTMVILDSLPPPPQHAIPLTVLSLPVREVKHLHCVSLVSIVDES